MRILLSGAAGFVGSHLAEHLVAAGHQVVGVDDLSTGRADNLANLRGAQGFEFIEHDMVRPLAVPGGLGYVMHFASPASPPKYRARGVATLRVNAEGTFHALELARRKGAVFFLASTSEVYGDPEVHPQPETYWGNVNPVGPRSVYDEGKRYAEALVRAYGRRHALGVRIARIFNTYGPRLDPSDGRVVTNLAGQALCGEPLTVYGDGTQTRSFQYITDLIDGIVRLMAVDYAGPVNLGNPVEITVAELARLVREVTGSPSPIVFRPAPEDDPRRRCPDITLARRLLGWEPKVPLGEGLVRTVEYLRLALGLRAVAGAAAPLARPESREVAPQP